MKKRFRFIAVIMTMVMTLSFTAPSAAFAYYHYYPHYYGHHHHWSRNAWKWGLGILALSLFVNANTNKPYKSAYTPVVSDYESGRASFINSLDEKEYYLFKEIEALAPNKPGHRYIYEYGGKDVTRRRLQKIMNALSDEFRFEKYSDGRVYFRKLK